MNLSQILIEAGVTPDDLHTDCKFIAQDGDEYIFQYSGHPFFVDHVEFYANSGCIEEVDVIVELSEDWQTPLSREQFIADYDTHLTIQMNQDQWYSDLIR
jgi:hypothetical protein